jgi:hypothetical protein
MGRAYRKERRSEVLDRRPHSEGEGKVKVTLQRDEVSENAAGPGFHAR